MNPPPKDFKGPTNSVIADIKKYKKIGQKDQELALMADFC